MNMEHELRAFISFSFHSPLLSLSIYSHRQEGHVKSRKLCFQDTELHYKVTKSCHLQTSFVLFFTYKDPQAPDSAAFEPLNQMANASLCCRFCSCKSYILLIGIVRRCKGKSWAEHRIIIIFFSICIDCFNRWIHVVECLQSPESFIHGWGFNPSTLSIALPQCINVIWNQTVRSRFA